MHSYLGEADTMFEWMKKNINEERDERPAKIIHKICVRRGSDCYDVGRHFVLKFSIYCHFKHDKAGIFEGFQFIWKRRIRCGKE